MAYVGNSNTAIDVFLDEKDIVKMYQAIKGRSLVQNRYFVRVIVFVKGVEGEVSEQGIELQLLDDQEGKYTNL